MRHFLDSDVEHKAMFNIFRSHKMWKIYFIFLLFEFTLNDFMVETTELQLLKSKFSIYKE